MSLEVPGLAEKRPSLAIGDTALAGLSNSPESQIYEGCIHEVRSKSVLLMFDEKFHQFYTGEVYDIEFRFSRSQFKKMHQAIEEVVKNFGKEVLFPVQIKALPPQVNFSLENPKLVYKKYPVERKAFQNRAKSSFRQNGSPGNYLTSEEWILPVLDTNMNESCKLKLPKLQWALRDEFKSKKMIKLPYVSKDLLSNVKSGQILLKWVNTSLNHEQKNAVMRILSGEARPLPYIVYGPPGISSVSLISFVESKNNF